MKATIEKDKESMEGRVLIVDDELLINKLLETRLTRDEFKVDVAFDGIEALKKASSNKYDVILTDLMIPNIAGRELIMELQNSKLNSETPIIVLSSLASDELIVDILGSGVKDYIVKPFSLNVVIAKIKQLMLSDLSPV
ncbi:MAG: response regulator transcription factor [Bacteroidota bacterium]